MGTDLDSKMCMVPQYRLISSHAFPVKDKQVIVVANACVPGSEITVAESTTNVLAPNYMISAIKCHISQRSPARHSNSYTPPHLRNPVDKNTRLNIFRKLSLKCI